MKWDERCFICEGKFAEEDDQAEMYDPKESDRRDECHAHIVHAECGDAAGWEVA